MSLSKGGLYMRTFTVDLVWQGILVRLKASDVFGNNLKMFVVDEGIEFPAPIEKLPKSAINELKENFRRFIRETA